MPELDDLARVLPGILEDGDLLVTLGAGSIGAAATQLPAWLSAAGEQG